MTRVAQGPWRVEYLEPVVTKDIPALPEEEKGTFYFLRLGPVPKNRMSPFPPKLPGQLI